MLRTVLAQLLSTALKTVSPLPSVFTTATKKKTPQAQWVDPLTPTECTGLGVA